MNGVGKLKNFLYENDIFCNLLRWKKRLNRKKFLFGVNKGLETQLIGHLAYLIFLQKLSIVFLNARQVSTFVQTII